jgi:thiamine transport system permease protein
LIFAAAWPVAALIGRVTLVPAAFWTGPMATTIVSFGFEATAQAAVSTALTLLIGLPMTFLISRFTFTGRRLMSVLLTIPFVLPTVVIALAFVMVLPAQLEYGLFAVLLAHIYLNLAVVYRLVGPMLSEADARYAQVAQTLGASSLRANLTFTLRYAAPAIISAAGIVFVFCFTSLGIVVLLGARETSTWEVEILRRTTLISDIDSAVVISLVQAVLVAVALGASFLIQRRSRMPLVRAGLKRDIAKVPRRFAPFIYAALTLCAVLLMAPIFALFTASLTSRSGFTLNWWRDFWIFEQGTSGYLEPWAALQTSLTFAVLTGVVAASVTLAVALLVIVYPNVAGWALLLVLPLGLSAVTVGLGLLVAYGGGGLGVASSVVLIVISHSLIAVPLVLSAVLPSVRSLDARMRAVAVTLGAKPWRAVFTAFGPTLRKAGFLSGGLAAGVSLGEFGAASVLTRIDSMTLPLMIARTLNRPGEASLGIASVAGVLLVVLVALVVWGFDRVATK